jgi:hypothetical protein
MRTLIPVIMTVLFLSVSLTSPLSAHHSFAGEFDGNKPIKLRGTVTNVRFINPHSWLYIDVKGDDGKVTNWAIEGGTPNSLFRRGITKASLPIGTEILVDGYLARDGSNKVNGRDITYPDGKKVFFSAPSDTR